MQIGFIGAGKVGTSLGRYLYTHGIPITGYYSRNAEHTLFAAKHTQSQTFTSIQELVEACDIIWITVTDSAIATIWEKIDKSHITDKCFCHCSGALSSQIFTNREQYGAFGCSLHPLYAISDKETSYKTLGEALFTLEGDQAYVEVFQKLFSDLGNPVQQIDASGKQRYHAAAVFTSNHVIALVQVATNLLKTCGFSDETALAAIRPLLAGNTNAVLEKGPLEALTGPVERNDATTITKHLSCLPDGYIPLYKELTRVLLELASLRHPEADYSAIEEQIKL
ncbi:MAG: DUF2520 domain-containing protein [Lachnospiraceae bacterium]|nr:DUF2520 domain-containing protein [Lachnospiraceae bacterium]